MLYIYILYIYIHVPLQETNTISHQTGSWENHRLNRDMLVPGGGGIYTYTDRIW